MDYSSSDRKDPLWQHIVYIWLNPLFRLLHFDKHNILCLVLFFLTRYSYGFAILSFIIWFVKRYLICGPCTRVYSKRRAYGSSYLDISTDIPVLHLNTGSHFENGYHYGCIMAEEIIYLINRFKSIVRPKIPVYVLYAVDEILPTDIKEELRGVHEAVNKIYPLSYWDLLTIQMAPEIAYMGCTCYASFTKNKKIILGRNMDWLPFSSAQYSIVIRYKDYNSLVVPGLVGCVTAWNKQFFLAMNVAGAKYPFYTGIPSTLKNKHIMNSCTTFNEACNTALNTQLPMTAYHLTLANSDNAVCYSYYQNINNSVTVRNFGKGFDEPNLIVLNWSYPIGNRGSSYVSAYRNKNICLYGRSIETFDSMRAILKRCQSFETIHSVIIDFETDTIHIGIDNGFAVDLLRR